MRFVVTVRHSTERCWAREENEEKAKEWVASMGDRAEDAGITVHASYVAPNEHIFYFVLEAESFEGVSEFLGPPLLQDHDADVVPVLTFGEIEQILEEA